MKSILQFTLLHTRKESWFYHVLSLFNKHLCHNLNKAVFKVFLMGFAIIVLFPICLSAQTELRLLNGKSLPILKYSVDYDANIFYYQTKKSSGKLVTRSVLLDEVFSYTDSLNKVQVVYAPFDEQQMSVSEMEVYVTGANLAFTEYQPYFAMIGGFLVSGAGVFFFNSPIVGLGFPIVFTASMALVKPSADDFMMRVPQYADDDMILNAYQRSGKNKAIKYGAIGSAGGTIVALLIKSIISSN